EVRYRHPRRRRGRCGRIVIVAGASAFEARVAYPRDRYALRARREVADPREAHDHHDAALRQTGVVVQRQQVRVAARGTGTREAGIRPQLFGPVVVVVGAADLADPVRAFASDRAGQQSARAGQVGKARSPHLVRVVLLVIAADWRRVSVDGDLAAGRVI